MDWSQQLRFFFETETLNPLLCSYDTKYFYN